MPDTSPPSRSARPRERRPACRHLGVGHVIDTGRSADRQTALDFGAHEFVDLDSDTLEDAGGVDLVST
jgi:hypothetical protein